MSTATKTLIVVAVCATTLAFSAVAKNPHGKHDEPGDDGRASAASARGFSAGEAQVLRSYYVLPSGKAKPLPPGLQKKLARGGELPPGWRRKLTVGEVVPQQVYRLAEPVPVSVAQRLPPQPPNSVLVRLDTQIMRLDRSTLTVTAVFDF